ncbi:MAG: TonB-dependent receptor [Parabacteroides sp.]|nr:TonB-dependent receptor [Parabacteroides sp.]
MKRTISTGQSSEKGKALRKHAFPYRFAILLICLCCFPALILYAQDTQRVVTGTVTDKAGISLPGASVVVKGVAQGTVTDADGNFSLPVPSGSVLEVSFIGYKTASVQVTGSKNYRIALEEDNHLLEQVVVISYGTARKKEIIGSVSSVDLKDVKSVPVNRIEQALQGKVAGVMVTQSYGQPGSPMNINIRGVGTIGDSDPLYVIDGIPTKTGINSLNPGDIESISILKDASAAAMYGSRAANGVVLVKTKSGKEGRVTIDFDAYLGVQSNAKTFDMLDASEWADVRNRATLNDNPSGNVPWPDTNLGKGTDWQKEVFRDALMQNYNLSITGGSAKTQYAISMNHFQQDGIIRYSDYARNSVRANVDANPVKWLKVGNNFSFSQIKQNGVDIEVNGVLKNAILAVPTMSVYNADGSFAGPNSLLEGNGANPLAMAARSNIRNLMYRVTDNAYAEITLLKGLTFKSSLGLDLIAENNRDFDPSFQEGDNVSNIASLTQGTNLQLDWIWENVLNYKFSVARNNFNLLAGVSIEENTRDWTNITKSSFPGNYDYLQYLSNGSVADANDITGLREEWSMASYFGRADYNFADKYLASASIRVDGSSRFAAGNRYAAFPSFAVGWRASEEAFLKKYDWLDDLKIKASWGQLGNQDIGLYAFTGTLSPYYYNFNNQAVVGYAPSAAYNPHVSWETTTQTDFGLDFSLFNGALGFEADYYIKTTDDMLVQLPVSAVSGFSNGAYINSGSVRNQGIELSLTHARYTGPFTYSINANFTTVKNKVLSLGGNEMPIDDTLFFDYTVRTEKGQPMRQMYGYVMEGIYQDEQEIKTHLYNTENPSFQPGDVRYKDINNDGKIDASDRTVIGNTIPKFLYGLSANAAYKGFDLSVQFQGVGGNDIYNATKWWSENTGETHNYGRSVLDSWTGPGTSDTMPRLTLGSTQNNVTSSRYVEKGDYLRLKNLTIGYTLPAPALKKMHIRSLRFYASAQNLFTITGYSGFDPEVGTSRTDNRSSYGFDEITYPQARTFTFGINLGIL